MFLRARSRRPCTRARRTLNDVLGFKRGRQGGAHVLDKLDKQRVDLVERAQRLRAELDGGDLFRDTV